MSYSGSSRFDHRLSTFTDLLEYRNRKLVNCARVVCTVPHALTHTVGLTKSDMNRSGHALNEVSTKPLYWCDDSLHDSGWLQERVGEQGHASLHGGRRDGHRTDRHTELRVPPPFHRLKQTPRVVLPQRKAFHKVGVLDRCC